MKILKISYLFILIVFISGCSSVPKNTSNSCSIFDERYLWYKHAKKTEKKWGTPVYLQLAIINMESSFNRFAKPPRQKIFKERYFWYKHAKKSEQKWGTPVYLQLAIINMESSFNRFAKPPRQKLFKVVPYKRPSSSFGYSQAVKGTWKQYKDETGNKFATRSRFKDSVDFIGWYTNKTEKILKVSKKDAFRQYIAYHEGWGDYKNYKKNKKVINLAKRVEKQSNIYKQQLSDCKNSLSTSKYIIF